MGNGRHGRDGLATVDQWCGAQVSAQLNVVEEMDAQRGLLRARDLDEIDPVEGLLSFRI